MNRFWVVLGYGALAGLLLAAFSLISGMIKFAFSLGAFLLGLKFMGTYETWGIRFAFIGTAVLFFLFFIMLYTVLAFAYEWPLPTMPEA